MNGTISLQSKLKGAVTMANTIINGGASPYPKTVGPAAIASFSDGAQDAPLKSLVFNIEPVQDLHGYDSPWPAGGGKNKLIITASDIKALNNLTWTNNSAVNNGITFTILEDDAGNVTGIRANGTASATAQITISKTNISQGIYFLSAEYYSSSAFIRGVFRDANNAAISIGGSVFTDLTAGEAYREVPSNVSYINIYININSGTTVNNVVFKPMFRVRTESSAYAASSNICPISGWTQVSGKHSGADMTDYTPITISLGQTVYGGTLDVVRGKLVVDRVCRTYITFESFSASPKLIWLASDAKPVENSEAGNIIASYLPTTYVNNIWANTGINGVAGNPGGYIYARIAGLSTSEEYREYLASNPLQVCYELATPIEVDLTPHTIKTLLGVNNIWADAGDTTLEYYPAAASIVSVLNRSSKVYTSIPLGKIRYETYQITPQQTIDLDSYRSENGNLLRNPVATKCKIEFNTPLMTDSEWADVWRIIKAGFNNNTERKLKLRYYDTLSATYKTGYFYVPDVQTTIRNIEEGAGVINYNEIRIAFIEY